MRGDPAPSRLQDPSPLKLSALFVAVAMQVLGNGLNGTVLGVRGVAEGMASAVIGAVASTYFLGFAVGAWLAPQLIEVVGHIRAFATLTLVGSAIAIGYAILVDPWDWFGSRLVYGACYASLVIVVESRLNASTRTAYRGRHCRPTTWCRSPPGCSANRC